MTHAIPRAPRLGLALGLVLLGVIPACSHTGERDRLIGYWEGTLPLPSTGQQLPIAYDFRADGLTVMVGLGDNRTVTDWEHWEVRSAQDGDIVLHIHRGDGRVFATLVRYTGDDELMLWDLGTDESTAAHVRRVGREPSGEGAGTGASRPEAGGSTE